MASVAELLGVSSDTIYRFDHVKSRSCASRAKFAGRKVGRHTVAIWQKIHKCGRQPIGLFGAAIGAAMGHLGGAVYEAGMDALGRRVPSKPLADYALRPAQAGYKIFRGLAGPALAPVIGVLALGFSASGVLGAVAGATISVLGAPVYQKMKHALGDNNHTKRLSDYVIDAATLGAKVGMMATAAGAVVAGAVFCPWITVLSLMGVLVSLLSALYIKAGPVWLEA